MLPSNIQLKITAMVLGLSFTSNALLPHNALAFEAGLPHANKQALVAKVYLKDRDSDLVLANETLPAESYRSAAAMAALSSLTKSGDWPKPAPARTRLAFAPAVPVIISGEPVILKGEASYYSRSGCLGCDPAMIMANGQPLNDNALTMAIGAHLKHLVGRQATVTSLATGKSVRVLITDTGGFYQAKYGHRVADLTVATKQAIGMAGGVGQVRVEVD